MAYTPDTKNPGNLIRSADWNETTEEVVRLEADKVDRAGDAVSGSLTIAGDLGVGTASPQAKLHIDGGTDATLGAGGYLTLGAISGVNLTLDKNEIMARISGGKSPLYLQNLGGDLVVHTDRFVVKDNGNVGVGTAGPEAKLHLFRPNSGSTPLLKLGNQNQPTYEWSFDVDGTATMSINNEGGGTPFTAMSINSFGNIGVGKAPSTAKLDISGDVKISNSLAVGGAASATGQYSVALGVQSLASGLRAIAIGDNAKATSQESIAIGSDITVSGGGALGIRLGVGGTPYTVSEPGVMAILNGDVGIGTTSPDYKLDVQGGTSGYLCQFYNNNNGTGPTSGLYAVGDASDTASYAGGVGAVISGQASSNGGGYAYGSQNYAHAYGSASAYGVYAHAIGGLTTGREYAFYGSGDGYFSGNVGIGSSTPTHKLEVHGSLWVRNWGTVGSDYAEYFESQNGKAIPAGTAVVLENGKVKPAKQNEIPIGIVSANPGMAGGVHVEWPKKYLRDEFGNPVTKKQKVERMVPKKEKIKNQRQKLEKKTITEKVTRVEVVLKGKKHIQQEVTEKLKREVEEPVFEEVDLYDESGKKKIGKHSIPVMEEYEEEIDVLDENGMPVLVGSGEFDSEELPKLNPDYDESRQYIPREDRPEWHCVGLLGQLPLRKGQPVVDSWVKIKKISDKVELWLVK